MAATNYTPISLYYSTTAAAVPVAGNLALGELAINITDGILYYKNPSNVVTPFASGGASADGVIYENSLIISANYTLTTAKNGFSVGPITINSGISVTVPSGQRWVVL
jgi:hypothetical protein